LLDEYLVKMKGDFNLKKKKNQRGLEILEGRVAKC
jgi:hypothetical protein